MPGPDGDHGRGGEGDRGQDHHRLRDRAPGSPQTRGPHPRGQQCPRQDSRAAPEPHRGQSRVPQPQDPADPVREPEPAPEHRLAGEERHLATQ